MRKRLKKEEIKNTGLTCNQRKPLFFVYTGQGAKEVSIQIYNKPRKQVI